MARRQDRGFVGSNLTPLRFRSRFQVQGVSVKVPTMTFVEDLQSISSFDHLQTVNQLPAQTKPCNTLPSWNGGVADRSGVRADVSISTRLHFLGIPERVFFKFDTGKLPKCYY